MTVTWTWDTADDEERDDYEAKLADVREAPKLRSAIWDFTEWLQREVRKGDPPADAEAIRTHWNEILIDYGVHPWDDP